MVDWSQDQVFSTEPISVSTLTLPSSQTGASRRCIGWQWCTPSTESEPLPPQGRTWQTPWSRRSACYSGVSRMCHPASPGKGTGGWCFFLLNPSGRLGQWFSKCGPQNSSIGITWLKYKSQSLLCHPLKFETHWFSKPEYTLHTCLLAFEYTAMKEASKVKKCYCLVKEQALLIPWLSIVTGTPVLDTSPIFCLNVPGHASSACFLWEYGNCPSSGSHYPSHHSQIWGQCLQQWYLPQMKGKSHEVYALQLLAFPSFSSCVLYFQQNKAISLIFHLNIRWIILTWQRFMGPNFTNRHNEGV